MAGNTLLHALILCLVVGPGLHARAGQDAAREYTGTTPVEEDGTAPPDLQWPTPIPGCVERPLSQLVVPFDNGDDILILTGTGRRIARVGPKKKRWKGVRPIYASPSVHPDQDRIVAVRCENVPDRRSHARLISTDIECGIAEITWDHAKRPMETILYMVPRGSFPYAPAYSPDGSKIAFFLADAIVILDRETPVLLHTISTGIDIGRWPLHSEDRIDPPRVFWSHDGRYLVGRYAFREHMVVSVETQTEWHVPRAILSYYDITSSFEARRQMARGPWGAVLSGTLALGINDKELLRSYYPWPLGWSPCRRYFWYFHKRDGWFAVSAFKVYDVVEKRSHLLKLLAWAPWRQ